MPLSSWRVAAGTPVRRAMVHQPSFGCTVYVPVVIGVGSGAVGSATVRSTMPGWSTVDSVMPLSSWRVAAGTPVRRAMVHQPSFGCTVYVPAVDGSVVGAGVGAGVAGAGGWPAAVAMASARSRRSSKRAIRCCPGHAVADVARCGKIVSTVTGVPAAYFVLPPEVRVTRPRASMPSRYR